MFWAFKEGKYDLSRDNFEKHYSLGDILRTYKKASTPLLLYFSPERKCRCAIWVDVPMYYANADVCSRSM